LFAPSIPVRRSMHRISGKRRLSGFARSFDTGPPQHASHFRKV